MAKRGIIEGSPVEELLGSFKHPEPKATSKSKAVEKRPSKAPEGYRLDPRYIEKKAARLQLVLEPSVFKKLKAVCEKEGVSVNSYVGSLIKESLGIAQGEEV